MEINRKIALCFGSILYESKLICDNDGSNIRYSKTGVCAECHRKRSCVRYKNKKIKFIKIKIQVHVDDADDILRLADALNSARKLNLINN